MVAIIIIILVVVAVLYFKGSKDPIALREELKKKVRNETQKKALRYFLVDNEGCLGFLAKTVKDAEYDALVKSTLATLNSKQNAINKIGLDESELKEIDPVTFEGYVYGDNNFAKRGKDNLWRSSKYQISWLFFTDKQVFLYQYTLNFDEDGKKEATEEYFWKDITNFSTSSDTIEQTYYDYKAKQEKKENVQSSRFALTVPGDKFYCWMEQSDDKERAIQGMKAKLREKKNA
jgi:hypothetical protein